MVQLHQWLNSKFKEISKYTSHAQIRVKIKNLWPQLVEEEKQAIEKKVCRDISRLCCDKACNKERNFVTTNPDYVATKSEDKIFRNKVLVCCDKARRQNLSRRSFIMSQHGFFMS